ncbi:MAG: DUF4783 domain-containing protein [Crocinitomicaceae bacterium]|nr:DUF4783 domain-containing protein [Crocinitomicaceae bacterium]
MNVLYSLLTSFVFLWNVGTDVPYDAIEKAFRSNNSKEIVEMSKTKVLINVLGKEGAYSKSQAGLVLKGFFGKNPGSEFEYVFKGKQSTEGTFAIGNYKTKDSIFRVTIHFKKVSNDFKVESLKIEKV